MRARARARVRVCFRPPKKMQGASPGITFFVVHKPYWSSVYVCTSSIVVFGFEKRRSWNARKHRRDENVGGKGKRANSFRSAPPRYSTGTTAFDIARTQNPSTHSHTPIPPAQTEHKRSAPALEVGVQTRAAPTRVSGTFLRPPNCFHTRAPRSVSPSQNPRRVLTN